MQLFQTKLSKHDAKRSTELDQLRILRWRKVGFSEEEKYQLFRLEAGQVGEETVMEYLKEYGCDHWVVLRNVWLDDYGVSEVDILLITNDCVYVFEVKNYSGTFIYKDGNCMINGRNNKNNSIAQARKAYLNVRDIIQKHSYGVKVEGALVFAGIDNMVNIQSPVEDIQIVLRNQLRHYILKIAEREKANAFHPIDKEGLLQHLNSFQVSNPYLPKPLTPDEMTKLKRGICCAHCHSFNVEIGRSQYTTCQCGFSEPRDRAIVRTICEYGVLRYDENLKLEKLLNFFDGEASKNNLNAILHKYFKTVDKRRYTYQMNKKLPIEKLPSDFQFKLPMKLKLDNVEYNYL